jgi:ribonuclease H / adenosylcobalamin/alpha-ribazole phosphatase
VIRAQDGTPLVTLGRPIGRATNNVAEYQALITALKKALELGATKIIVRGDSELIIKQMRGEYRVKHPDLRPLHDEAKHLYHQFREAKLEHNLRHKNALADKLANLAMDRRAEVTDVDGESSSIQQEQPFRIEIGSQFACPHCGCAIQVKRPSSFEPERLKDFSCQCGTRMDPV